MVLLSPKTFENKGERKEMSDVLIEAIFDRLGIVTFRRFLAERNIDEEAAITPLLKEAWNQGIQSTINDLGCKDNKFPPYTQRIIQKFLMVK